MSVSQDQIEEMKKLILFSKRLSEWHLKNLKMWPLVVFNDLIKAEVEYNIGDRPDESYVNYLIRFKDDAKPQDFELRCKHLHQWVQNLLWTDIGFSVQNSEGKVLFPNE